MAQMWFINASALPFQNREDLRLKLTSAGWDCFPDDVDDKVLKVMIENDRQAKAVEDLVLSSNTYIEKRLGSY